MTNCWVMVDPPSASAPLRMLWTVARATPIGSTPRCSKKRASSAARTARQTRSGRSVDRDPDAIGALAAQRLGEQLRLEPSVGVAADRPRRSLAVAQAEDLPGAGVEIEPEQLGGAVLAAGVRRAPVDPDHLVAVEELARLVGPLVHAPIAQPFEPLDQREVARDGAGLDREGLRVDPRLVAPQLVLERGGVGRERKKGSEKARRCR